MRKHLKNARLYGILDTGYCPPGRFPKMAEALIRGGVDILQVRAKGADPKDIIEWAGAVTEITAPAGIPLIINDYPECVKEAGANGCHVGQDDLPVAEARSQMPEGSICGKSTHSLQQAKDAMKENPDYIGFGPIFSTPTKPDYGEIGLSDISSMMSVIQVPAFCIGGIKLENVETVLAAGALNLVIVSGLLCAANPEHTAREVRKRLDTFQSHMAE